MKTALSIGNFDGVHRGHRALIEALTDFRRHAPPQLGPIKTMALSFEPHPLEVLRPGTIIRRLSSLAQKTHLLQTLGVDEVKILKFTKELATTPAKDFFNNLLIQDLDPALIVVGENFFFGHNREGNTDKLQEWSAKIGIQVKVIAAVQADGAPVSSTKIRRLIEEGQLVAAGRLLGRDYSIVGTVCEGQKRGRTLGFPTANIVPQTSGIGALCIPSNGVYLTHSTLKFNGELKTFASVTNVGVKPTVQDAGPINIETHLLDFDGDVYEKELTVEFRDRLRDEIKFSSLSELQAQILKDVELARLKLRNS